jgi:hypothetical protein
MTIFREPKPSWPNVQHMLGKALLAVSLVLCASCEHSNLRGTFGASEDRKTHLAVVDDNGGQRGPIKVDGKVWPYTIGQAGGPNRVPIQFRVAEPFRSTSLRAFSLNSTTGVRERQ